MSNIIRKASQDSQSTHAKAFQIEDEEGSYAELLLLGRCKRCNSGRFPTASVDLQQMVVDEAILSPEEILYWGFLKNLEPKVSTTLQPEKFKISASSSSVVSDTMTVALDNHEALHSPTAPRPIAKRNFAQFESGQLEAHLATLRKISELSSAANPTTDHDVEMRDAQESSSSEEQPSNILKSDVPATEELTCPVEGVCDDEESR